MADSVLVEISGGGGYGRAVTRERLTLDAARRSFTIGRSLAADVIVDDEHVAALHANVEIAPDGRITVRDLGTANGIVVEGRKHSGSVLLPATNRLQIGRSTIKIRTAHDALPPERPVQHGLDSLLSARPGTIAAAAATLCLLLLGHSVWFGAPRDTVAALATTLGSAALVVAVWTAAWGLLSRILLGEWHWLRHAAIFLSACALYQVTTATGDFVGSVTSYAVWADQFLWVGLAVLCLALGSHLAHASSLTPRHAAIAAAAVFVLVGGGGAWSQGRAKARDVNMIDSRFQIYPAALRLRAAKSVDGFIKDASALRVASDRKRDAARARDSVEASGPF